MTHKIVLIACSSSKSRVPTKAELLYNSPLFKHSLAYAKSLNPDKIFILSALHGLVELRDFISPYNLSLNELAIEERKLWASKVLAKLQSKDCDFKSDNFVILAGNKYCEYIIPHLTNVSLPLKGLSIGKQLVFLKRSII